MTKFNKIDLGYLTFPDADVLDFTVDLPERSIEVKCSDVYVKKNPNGHSISNVELRIAKFNTISIYEYKDERNNLILSYSPSFGLKDICEFSHSDVKTVIKGFSKVRGYWTEYIVDGGEFEVVHD